MCPSLKYIRLYIESNNILIVIREYILSLLRSYSIIAIPISNIKNNIIYFAFSFDIILEILLLLL